MTRLPDEYLTVPVIAKVLGVSEDHTRDLILYQVLRAGLLKAKTSVPLRRVFPKELQAAVAVYKALYGNGSVPQLKRGHKDRIQTWLKEHYPQLSKEAIARITTVVNPNKRGGAPKILGQQ